MSNTYFRGAEIYPGGSPPYAPLVTGLMMLIYWIYKNIKLLPFRMICANVRLLQFMVQKFKMITTRWSNKRPLQTKVWSIWKKHFFSYKTFATIKLTEWWQAVVTRVAESEIKYPTPTFPKFPIPTPSPDSNYLTQWQWNLAVKIMEKEGPQSWVREGEEGSQDPRNFEENFSKSHCFFDFKREKQNFTTFGPTWKNLVKNF